MQAVVGLGSNVGSRAAFLRAARDVLAAQKGCRVRSSSPIYATPPMGPPQPWYLNAAVRVETVLDAHGLLSRLLAVEAALGRVRRERWGPRTVDLDLLWTDGPVVEAPDLQVPHPGLRSRAFALAPLLDVAAELRGEYEAALLALGGTPAVHAMPAQQARGRMEVEGGITRIEAAAEDAEAAFAAALTGTLRHLQPQAPERCSVVSSVRAVDAESFMSEARRLAQCGLAVRWVTALRVPDGWEGRLVGGPGSRWKGPETSLELAVFPPPDHPAPAQPPQGAVGRDEPPSSQTTQSIARVTLAGPTSAEK